MKKRFRIKLKSGRMVGPFSVAQVGELYKKGHVNGTEQCQEYPTGDWEEFKNFEELVDEIVRVIGEDERTGVIDEATKVDTIARLGLVSKLKQYKSRIQDQTTSKPKGSFNEFQFEKKQGTSNVDYDELERKHEERKLQGNNDVREETEFDFAGLDKISEEESSEREEEDEEEDGLDRTRIVRRPVNEGTIEKTLIVNKETLDKIKKIDNDNKALQASDHPEEFKVKKDEELEEEDKTKFSSRDATEFIKLDELLPAVKEEAQLAESEIERKLEKERIDREKESEERKKRKEERRQRREELTKKGMRPIAMITFIVVIWFVLFDEEEKVRPLPQRINISFPVTQTYEDPEKAKQFLAAGIKSYQVGTFLAKVSAASLFKESLSHQFRSNKALGWLIRTYADIYPNAKSKSKAANTLHRLLKIGYSKVLTDENISIGSARFFSVYGKYKTGLNVIENFLRVGKPSLPLLVTYLDLLLKEGELTKARKVFDKLYQLPKKDPDTIIVLANYLEQDERLEEADKLVKEGLKKNRTLIPLLLKSANYEFEKGKYKSFASHLKLIEELNSGSSPIYYAKYLEFMGMASAVNGKLTLAARLFNKALKINESDQLRSKLGSLTLGGTESVEALILQSKVINKMKYAKMAVRENNWEKAFKFAIEAVDMLPTYIPSQLLLADIQITRGFFESAVDTLTRLRKKNAVNPNVNFKLIEAHIASSKLDEAGKLIQMISQTKLRSTAGYASVLGKYYLKKKNDVLAVKWLRESIKRFPLNDEDYFLLAKIFLRNRKYDNAIQMLNEAIALDPKMVEYRTTYAEILYERSDTDAALGYLRDILDENKDSPKILGEIAIYYYRSGQMKKFEEYKKRVENLPNKDQGFYEFLIKAAKLDERYQDVIKYSRQLIKVNPGDLETRMILGEYLYKEKQLPASVKVFESIVERLKGFPRSHYYLAKIYLDMGKIQEALDYSETEIKKNPTLEFGYFIRGECFKAMKEFQKAINDYEKAISINGKYVEALMGLGWIKHRQNFYEEARELYLRAKKSDESNPEVYKRLGYVYKTTGNSGLAVESFQTYLDLYPAAPDRTRIEAEIKDLR